MFELGPRKRIINFLVSCRRIWTKICRDKALAIPYRSTRFCQENRKEKREKWLTTGQVERENFEDKVSTIKAKYISGSTLARLYPVQDQSGQYQPFTYNDTTPEQPVWNQGTVQTMKPIGDSLPAISPFRESMFNWDTNRRRVFSILQPREAICCYCMPQPTTGGLGWVK